MPRAHEGRRVYRYLLDALAHPEQHPCLVNLVIQNMTGRLRCRTPVETVDDKLREIKHRLSQLEWLVYHNNQRRLAVLEFQSSVLVACLEKLLTPEDKRRKITTYYI